MRCGCGGGGRNAWRERIVRAEDLGVHAGGRHSAADEPARDVTHERLRAAHVDVRLERDAALSERPCGEVAGQVVVAPEPGGMDPPERTIVGSGGERVQHREGKGRADPGADEDDRPGRRLEDEGTTGSAGVDGVSPAEFVVQIGTDGATWLGLDADAIFASRWRPRQGVAADDRNGPWSRLHPRAQELARQGRGKRAAVGWPHADGHHPGALAVDRLDA